MIWIDQVLETEPQDRTHSIPSMNGVSSQFFSGNLCKITPLLEPLPETYNI